MRFGKKKEREREQEMVDFWKEAEEKGLSLVDVWIGQMVRDGYIDKDGKIEYPSD